MPAFVEKAREHAHFLETRFPCPTFLTGTAGSDLRFDPASPPAITFYTVAEKRVGVLAKHGLSVKQHHLLAHCSALNLLVSGVATLVACIGRAAAKADDFGSVCTEADRLADRERQNRPLHDLRPRPLTG